MVITSRGHSAWFAHSERFASEFPHFRLKFPFLYSPNIWYRLWNTCKQCPIVKYCLQAYKWYFKLIPARLIIRFLIGLWSYTFDLYLSSQMGSRMLPVVWDDLHVFFIGIRETSARSLVRLPFSVFMKVSWKMLKRGDLGISLFTGWLFHLSQCMQQYRSI